MAEKNNKPHFVNSDSFMADKNYVKWLSDLKKRFRLAQLKAAIKVITTPLGVASYQLQEVYERTLLEIKQQTSEEETSESED